MKNKVLLGLGVFLACQLGYSENVDTKTDETKNVEVKQVQSEEKTVETQNQNTNLDSSEQTSQTSENPEEKQQTTTETTLEQKLETAPSTQTVPVQPRKSVIKTRKEKKLTTDEKLDLQLIQLERMLKSLEGR